MSNSSITWVDIMSATAGSMAVILSLVAVLVTVRIARQNSRQTQAIAADQEQRDLATFQAARKSEFREQCREVLASAEAIATLTSPRVSELLSVSAQESADKVTLRRHLAQLSAEVSLLTTFRDLPTGMPWVRMAWVEELLEEAAWVFSDALHLVILGFETVDDREEVDLRNPQAVVDALLNGSAVNLDPRLLPGYDLSTTGPEASRAAWQAAYDRRDKTLMSSEIVTGAPLPDSLTEAAARSLQWVSIPRFADRASRILSP